jgi:hypothetical protein
MKPLQKFGALLGVGGDRSAPPPTYVAVADGLIVTETAAEGWYVLASSNTDLMPEEERDTELDAATAALSKTLAGRDCHLRVLWAPDRVGDYREDAAGLFSAGNWQAWAEMRVRRLTQIDQPVRHLLLGVRLRTRNDSAARKAAARTQQALGVASTGIGTRELAALDSEMRRLGRRLESSPWKARPATVETLAWMITREQHRTSPLPAPAAGLVTGAKLATLTRGRVLPLPDHLQVLDGRGDVAAWKSILVMPGFPEELDSPGAGEWLRVLGGITYVPELDEAQEAAVSANGLDELHLPVIPEASVRFRVQAKREALKKARTAGKSAKEQRNSAAKSSAETTGLDVEETEAVMGGLARDMLRDGVTLVEDHPRLVVTSTLSLDDLRARIDAVVTYYGEDGIDVSVAEDEMRELWLECQPGDQVRVPDLGHVRDVTALCGSWWWGGSHTGDTHGPIAGYLTGTSGGPFRHDITEGSDRKEPTSTLFVGQSGKGKTTALMLSLLDAAFRGAFSLALDFKGDLAGLVDAGRYFGLPAHLVEITPRHAGALDLFRLLDREGSERAQIEVPAQLTIAVPPHLRARGAETPIQYAVNEVIREGGTPGTWRVIEFLCASPDPFSVEVGEALGQLAKTGLGAPFMGKPTGEAAPLRPEPGLWVVQMPGLALPQPEVSREDWTPVQRMSVALMHSLLAYGITTAGRPDLRGMRKIIAVPEVHVLLATREGAAFLGYIARVGRALSTSLALDTQDVETLRLITAIIEQLRTVVAFQLTTEEQQDHVCRMLGLPVGPHSRALLGNIGRNSDGSTRHGHSIVRDSNHRCATVQWDIPTQELAALLDTSPKAPDEEPEHAETTEAVPV